MPMGDMGLFGVIAIGCWLGAIAVFPAPGPRRLTRRATLDRRPPPAPARPGCRRRRRSSLAGPDALDPTERGGAARARLGDGGERRVVGDDVGRDARRRGHAPSARPASAAISGSSSAPARPRLGGGPAADRQLADPRPLAAAAAGRPGTGSAGGAPCDRASRAAAAHDSARCRRARVMPDVEQAALLGERGVVVERLADRQHALLQRRQEDGVPLETLGPVVGQQVRRRRPSPARSARARASSSAR